jgi:hypothetical protein
MKRLLLIGLAALALIAAKPRKEDAYVIAIEKNVTISGASVEEILAVHEPYRGPMMWVRRNGRTYDIRDAAFVGRVRVLFAPQHALNPEQERISREEEALDREEERLEDAPRTAANERRLDEVRAKQRELSKREQALDEREEELDRASERELWKLVDEAIRSGLAKPSRRR